MGYFSGGFGAGAELALVHQGLVGRREAGNGAIVAPDQEYRGRQQKNHGLT